MLKLLGWLAGFLFFAVMAALIAWHFERYDLAIVAGGTAILGLVLVAMTATAGVVGWWTAQIMRQGAELAINATNANDSWDAKKTAALAGVMNTGARYGRTAASGDEPLALPLPGQTASWLPPLTEFADDVIDGEYR